MTDEPYNKREIDLLHDGIHEKLDSIIKKIDYTNGKVRKIIIGLVAVAAYSLGTGSEFFSSILKIFI